MNLRRKILWFFLYPATMIGIAYMPWPWWRIALFAAAFTIFTIILDRRKEAKRGTNG